MTKEEFLQLAEKYAQGTTSKSESQFFEDFMHQMNEQGVLEDFNFDQEEEIRIRLVNKIDRSISVHEEFLSTSTVENTGLFTHRTRHEGHGRWSFNTNPSRYGLIIVVTIFLVIISMTTHLWLKDQLYLKSKTAQHYVKKTERGQKSTIYLSDGSIVQLNAESELSYDDFSAKSRREVSLKGEAFFEIEKDASKPFIVHTGKISTRVLGTSFNINAYPEDDDIAVTVATGKVYVAHNASEYQGSDTNQSFVLQPGQQLIYTAEEDKLAAFEVDIEAFLAWKNDQIRFDDIPLAEAFQYLERWYNVEIDTSHADISACYVKGVYETNSLDNILESLSFINGLEYERNINKIIITKSGCL